jgi:large subunit ribosomal protein L2
MGKTIIQQARGHGSFTYRVRRKAYKYRIQYPCLDIKGKAKIIGLLHSAGHTCPIAKIKIGEESFYNPACQGLTEGQEVEITTGRLNNGDIAYLKDMPFDTKIINIELRPGDGGRVARAGGSYGTINDKEPGIVNVLLTNKNKLRLDENCRATIGVTAGQGRVTKPFVKAGRKHYLMKARNKLWPRTSALKFNAVDHPFGSGRGKRIKSKIAKRNAPPGAKVGHLRPRRTGVNK